MRIPRLLALLFLLLAALFTAVVVYRLRMKALLAPVPRRPPRTTEIRGPVPSPQSSSFSARGIRVL